MDCDHPQFDSLWLYRSNTTCNHQSTIIYQIYPLIYLLCWWCWWLKNPLNASNNQSTGLERSHNFSPCHRLVGFPVWVSSKFQAPQKISNTSPSTCIPEAKKQHQSWLSQCLSLLIVPIPFIYIYYIYYIYIIYIYSYTMLHNEDCEHRSQYDLTTTCQPIPTWRSFGEARQ